MVAGKYFHWTGYGMRLVGLSLEEGTPRVMEFEVRVQNGDSTSYQTHRLPVPPGREEEAEKVIERLGF